MTQPPTFSFATLVGAARAACQWRLLLLWVLWMLVPTAILGLSMWHMLRASLDYSVHAAALAQQLDLTAITDLLAAHGKNALAFNLAGLLAVGATLLISPLLAGMAVTAARAAATPGFGALTTGALAQYPRMLRMLIWSAVPLGLAALLGSLALDAAANHDAAALTASEAAPWKTGAIILAAMLLVLAHATLDAGRALLALDRRRSSALKAWWSGCRLLLARPLATLGAYALVSALGLGLAGLLAIARINVSGASPGGFIAAFVLVQLGVAVLGWMRSARLFALVDVARSRQG